MIPKYKRNTNIGVLIGLVLQILGMIAAGMDWGAAAMIGYSVFLAGVVVFLYGCFSYARAKGHSPWWGLLGLLSLIGLIVLIVLPDRYPQGASEA